MFTLEGQAIFENGRHVADVAPGANSDEGVRLVGMLNLLAHYGATLLSIGALVEGRNDASR